MLAKCPPLSSAEASGLQGPEKIPLSPEGSVTPALPVTLQHTTVKAKVPRHSFRKPQLQESGSINPIHSQLALWHGHQWKSLSHVRLCNPMDYSPWNSPGQNTRVGSHFLLQGIFPTQALNPGLLHCRLTLYKLSHKGSPRILQGIAYPSPAHFPNPGITSGSPTLQADSLPAEPQGKPTNTGMDSLSLLQSMEFSRPEYWSG